MKRLHKHRSAAIVGGFLLLVLVIHGHTHAKDRTQKIDELVSLYHEEGMFEGAVLVAEDGKVIYKKAFGLADREWGVPNTSDTKFKLASLTKQFTALLVMQLVEEGKIELEGKITDYLPGYRKDTGEQVTIHQLLTHTSGIMNINRVPGFWPDSVRANIPHDRFLRTMCSGDLDFEPGTQFSYCNTGYYLLATIVEEITGKDYAEVLRERIIRPLAMENTGVDDPELILPKRAAGYTIDVDTYSNAPHYSMAAFKGAGSLYSTVEDLYLWDQALYTDVLLSKKYRDIMFTPYMNGYACGIGVGLKQIGTGPDSVLVMGHSGDIAGHSSRIVRLTRDRHTIILLQNNQKWQMLGDMSGAITAILYDTPHEQFKKSIARELAMTIREKGIESAIVRYREIREHYPAEYELGENELNTLGYSLMSRGDVKDAIEMFKLNVETYPDLWNVYDSLGEAHLRNGDRALAEKNYNKSLELNPQNTSSPLANEFIKGRN